MPQSWFQKNTKLKDAVASIQNDVAEQSLAFARAIAAREPGLNETVLAIEALCFYLHAFNFVIARSTAMTFKGRSGTLCHRATASTTRAFCLQP